MNETWQQHAQYLRSMVYGLDLGSLEVVSLLVEERKRSLYAHPQPAQAIDTSNLTGQQREGAERMNRLGVRMFRAGYPEYEAFAELAALWDAAQADTKKLLGAIAGGASPFPTSSAPPCPTP